MYSLHILSVDCEHQLTQRHTSSRAAGLIAHLHTEINELARCKEEHQARKWRLAGRERMEGFD